MHVLKPQTLGISYRPTEYRGRLGLSLSGYLHIPFDQGPRGRVWTEQSMWNFLAEEMDVPLIDEGVKKLTPEFLVHGAAYTTSERRDAVAVRAELAGVSKTLFAFGDRYWTSSNQATAPAPFETMPLDWRRAYGGEGDPANPVGKGRAAVDGIHWLPNLAYPDDRMLRRGQTVRPAGFGALDVMHPQRRGFQGRYDETWLKEHSPAVAPDTDWKYFNVAPRDQWIPQPLRGDEPYLLENLHPEQPLIHGHLPGLRVRFFINQRVAGGETPAFRFREVSSALTTVWFFPHAERMVLIYHGLAEVEEDDAFDIAHLMGAVERIDPDPARDDAHYLRVFEKRTAPGPMAGLQAINDIDLLPPGIGIDDPATEAAQAPFKQENFKEDAEFRKAVIEVDMARARLRANGQDPDALGIKPPQRETPPTPEEMPAYIEKLEKELNDQQWAAVEDMVTAVEKRLAMQAQGKFDPAREMHRGPPKFRARVQLDEMERRALAAGAAFDRVPLEDPMAKAELARRLDYQQSAHLQPPAHRLTGAEAEERRAEVCWLLESGQPELLPLLDLTGVDLSNLDLRGVDFSGAWLERADFRNANLSRAVFTGAVLAHADFGRAVAIGTDFTGANLGEADLDSARLDRANLAGAILMRTRFTRCSLVNAHLAGTNLLESLWDGADCSGAHLSALVLHKLDLARCCFVGATMARINLIECRLIGADFRKADLQGALLVECCAEGVSFAGADLTGAGLLSHGQFQGADFRQATLVGANFGDSDFSGARFQGARLDGANLTRAKLSGTDARRATAKGAMIRKADLRAANWSGVDFKDAILQGADLRGATLEQAHFFGADLTRVRLDGAVRLGGAELEQARIFPRRRPQPSDAET